MAQGPDRYPRRTFLGQCTAVPLGIAAIQHTDFAPQTQAAQLAQARSVGGADASRNMTLEEIRTETERLMRVVDAEVAYDYSPLAAEKNAWPYWARAHEAYISYEDNEDLKRILDEELDEHDRWPSGNDRRRVTEWLRKNEAAKALIDKGISLGQVELPRKADVAGLSLAFDEISLLRQLAYLKSCYCREALEERNPDTAAEEACSLLRMGSMVLQGQCMLVDYLVGMAVYAIGAAGVRRIGLCDGVDDKIRRRCIEQLTAMQLRAEDYKQTLRVEFCSWFLPQIAAYPEGAAPAELARFYIECEDGEGFQPTERQKRARQRFVDLTAQLLDGHPKPFDKDETVLLASRIKAESIRNVEQPWRKTNALAARTIRELAPWPVAAERELIWSGMYAAVDDEAKENIDPISKEKLSRARRQLRKVDNPFGKNVIRQSVSSIADADDLFPRNVARTVAVRLRIALCMFETRHGRLPKSLAMLVDERVLPDVPTDPFDGKSFKYSAKRRTIWSVGQDGKNDGTIPDKDDPENPFNEDFELTWRV
jgi:hypothetical protein